MRDDLVRILLVGGEGADYRLISQHLDAIEHSQYLLIWCEQLEEALSQMLSGDFDIAMLDCPDYYQPMQELVAQLEQHESRLPIIALTRDMAGDKTDGQNMAPHHHLADLKNIDYLEKGDLKPYLLDRYISDAIERQKASHRLSQVNLFDPLTGIPNRILFRQTLEENLELAKLRKESVGLLLINLDGFKRINESFGHDAGDKLVTTMAERLTHCVRKSDSVARICGDEFALVLGDVKNDDDMALVAKKVIDVLAAPVTIGGHPVIVSCSIGISSFPEAGDTSEDLLKRATMALVEAKGMRGSQYRFYDKNSNVKALHQLNMEADLRRALRKQEFELYYQPRVNLATGATVGMEALIRWRHPDRGMVSPMEFIPVAEETGLIVPIGYWVIQQACEDMKMLDQRGCNEMDVAVNLSFKQLQDSMFVDTASRIILQSGIDTTRLEFELTETAIMSNYQQTYEGMVALSKLGITFSLDDFGTGFSSFAHIQRLPISALKVDRSFIRSVVKDNEDAIIVKAMINLAHSLDLTVIAEGVETLDQVQFLWQNNCDQVQGYYFSPAVSAKDFSIMANQNASMIV